MCPRAERIGLEFHRRRKSLKSKTCFEGIKSFFSISLFVLSNACGKSQSRFSPISRKQSLIRNALSTAVQKKTVGGTRFPWRTFCFKPIAATYYAMPACVVLDGWAYDAIRVNPRFRFAQSALKMPFSTFLLRPHRLVAFSADTHGIFCPGFVRVWPRLRTT